MTPPLARALTLATLALAALAGRDAHACDAKALAKKVADASPAYVADAFRELAACSPDEARKAAAAALPRFIDAAGTPEALLAAIDLGAYEPVRAWIKAQTGSARGGAVTKLGAACPAHPAVIAFLADTQKAEGDKFWQDRWFKALADCDAPEARATLEAGLDHPNFGRGGRDRNVFQSLLEIYVKRAGAAALPRVQPWLAAPKDEEEAVIIVNAIGALVQGADKAEAVRFLESAAATLPPRAVERIRGLMEAAGDEGAASRVLPFRWRDRFDGGYTFGASITEEIVCKNEEKRAAFYVGLVREGGATWPDAWQAELEPLLRGAWSPDVGAKCKGTSTFTFAATPEPLAPGEGPAWIEAQKRAFARTHEGLKTTVVDGEAVSR
jgi:pimeloyl-ACP methyl ester carboxylesterase